MQIEPKILIGTLFCGEKEFNKCTHSLNRQKYKRWDHVVFKYLPNKAAHDTLYNYFMDNSKHYDLMIKLDADMVFITDEALIKIIELFRSNPSLDHAEIALQDWYSNSRILGLHAFSSRVKWKSEAEDLFVDTNPIIPGIKKCYWHYPAPLVIHCPNPSFFQAFHFGVHRGLKAIQHNNLNFNWPQSYAQWKLLGGVWRHFLESMDKRLGLVLSGADLALKGSIPVGDVDYTKPALRSVFQQYSNFSNKDLYNRLYPTWRTPNQRKRQFSLTYRGYLNYWIKKAINRIKQ